MEDNVNGSACNHTVTALHPALGSGPSLLAAAAGMWHCGVPYGTPGEQLTIGGVRTLYLRARYVYSPDTG